MHRCRWAHMARMPKQMQAPTCNLYSPPPKHHSRSIAFRHSIAHQQQERHPYPLSHSHLLPRSLTPPTDPSLPPSRRSLSLHLATQPALSPHSAQAPCPAQLTPNNQSVSQSAPSAQGTHTHSRPLQTPVPVTTTPLSNQSADRGAWVTKPTKRVCVVCSGWHAWGTSSSLPGVSALTGRLRA